jgi:hypothetical protein
VGRHQPGKEYWKLGVEIGSGNWEWKLGVQSLVHWDSALPHGWSCTYNIERMSHTPTNPVPSNPVLPVQVNPAQESA